MEVDVGEAGDRDKLRPRRSPRREVETDGRDLGNAAAKADEVEDRRRSRSRGPRQSRIGGPQAVEQRRDRNRSGVRVNEVGG